MPIKDLSDRVRLPRLGHIRLGIKKLNADKKEYPQATDFFVCPEEVRAIYSDQPRELDIMFPLDDDTKFAPQWLKCYSNLRGLLCRGNGETALCLVDIKTGEIATRDTEKTELREVLCDPDTCPRYLKKQCRQVMSLQFMLPKVKGFGVYQIDTTSVNSITNINSSIKMIRSICQNKIAMIPLTLSIGPCEVSPEGRKKTVWVLSLTSPYTILELNKFAQLPSGQALMLSDPLTEAPEDLYPDGVLEEESSPELGFQEAPPSQPAALEWFPDIPEAEERKQLWEKIQKAVGSQAVTTQQLLSWFSQHHITLSPAQVNAKSPPESVKIDTLRLLEMGLKNYQAKMKV